MDFDAIVVGAGFGGLYALKRLRDDLGLNAHLFERGGGVGGTWFWNRYPGAMSDTRAHLYCYSFDQKLLQDDKFSHHYRMQPEILSYLDNFTDRFNLRKDISLNSEVTDIKWDASTNLWNVTLADGKSVSTRFVVTSLGPLSDPNIPAIDGIETFKGEIIHTSRWPDSADWKGKKVGVVGTGSTGVQVITRIAPEVERLTVFQRSPQYSVPSGHGKMTDEQRNGIKQDYDAIWQAEKQTMTVFAAKESQISAHSVTAEERERIFEEAWNEGGGFRFMFGTFNDIITDEVANGYAQESIKAKIRQVVTDPATAEKLMPNDLYAKRPLCDSGYYQQFNRENVDLVDMKSDPIVRLDETGVILASGERHELDMLVFATGFDAVTGSYMRINIEGRDGLSIQDHWKMGARTYLGLMNVGFPNMLMVYGPNSPFSNIPPALEMQVDMVTELVGETVKRDARSLEPKQDAVDAWFDVCKELTDGTILPRARSWIFGANIPGKPYTLTFYMGGYSAYKGVLKDVREAEYKDLTFTH